MAAGEKVLVSLVKCQGCSINFSDDLKPRNLPCGHVLCTPCTESLLVDEKPCLECGEKQGKGETDIPPVNYPLLRVSRYSSKKEITIVSDNVIMLSADISELDQKKDLWKCNVHGNPNMLFCRSCYLWICVNCLVIDHPMLPRGGCRVLQLHDAKDQINKKYEEVVANIQNDMKTMIEDFNPDFGMHDFCLKHCTGERSHLRLLEKLEPLVFGKREENNEEVKKVKGNLKRMTDSFHATHSPEEITASCKELLQFQQESKAIIAQGKESLLTLRPLIMGHFCMEIKRLAEGRVPIYATLQEDGIQRWSRLCLVQELLLLYALNDGTPPSDGIIIPYKYMEMLMENDYKTVFLEVAAEEEPVSGRVLVKLENYNDMSKQMFLMCSGRGGTSYRDTQIFKEEEGSLSLGLSERNDDTREDTLGRARTLRAGTVLGHDSSNEFHIITRQHKTVLAGIFGFVMQGLRVIREVAKLQQVSKSFIKDCGVFIEMKPANDYT
ncbi:uncharacterized protein [Palaemon carinicauda]|uniref:uncharacterized protein n=1 Tax=Palaemon carinicauda TaxID=392227 RepID=UPI0035B69157